MYITLNKKINIKLGILFLILTADTVFAQQSGRDERGGGHEIVFSNNKWEDIVAKAKRTGKYIFVDAYTNWCAPCKLLKATTFMDKNAAAYFNKNFINYASDMEKGEGLELAVKWDVTAYPALLFFSPDGKMILKQIGYVDGNRLVEIGKQAFKRQ